MEHKIEGSFDIDSLINNPFNRSDYIRFLKTLFDVDIETQKLEIDGPSQQFIEDAEYLGEYESNREKIHFYIVNLSGKDVEKARVFQRDFIARDLENKGEENALVAFYSGEKWRLSLIKVDYIQEEKIKKKRRSAKRYSFFVGKGEVNNTCKQRINKLFNKEKLSIKDIEEAFSVEKVTDEFFQKYKSLFEKLRDEVKRLREEDNVIDSEFTEKNISEGEFAKKILAQIVFLYFLQKKGWLGIKRDPETRRFKDFGEGDPAFLSTLFKKAKEKGRNFFNDYLEKIFYEALANSERKADDYRFELDGMEWKIPFLNGGLFEPLGGYDWARTNIEIDNNIFSEIFSTFNRYNFTIREDEPSDQEVAIDPEMLGKVFENLIEENLRKGQGAYYTPREVVHYMCQQSLINYLDSNIDIDRNVLETFITKDHMEEIPAEIKKNKYETDNLLREIKIADPAVGSGAFLVGMMAEIVRARAILNENKKIFDLKEECIENNLHGVDIDPGAVEICQLRLWLSLVVDEENYGDVKPLPNLDYKIMCGNSLIEDYKGMKLWSDKWIGIKKESVDKNKKRREIESRIKEIKSRLPQLINKPNEKKSREREIKKLEKEKMDLIKTNETNSSLFQSDSERKLKNLKALHKKFINLSKRQEKKEYKEKIKKATIDLLEAKLKEEGNEEEFEELREIMQNRRSLPFFLWKLNFIEVFQRENPGFDVVIGNPPYVDSETMVKRMPENRKEIAENYKTAKGNWDLYIPFFELAYEINRKRGILSFITPNKWLSVRYGSKLREMFLYRLIQLCNCNNVEVFEAGNTPEISFIKKSYVENDVKIHYFNEDYLVFERGKVPRSVLEMDNWGMVLSEYMQQLVNLLKNKNSMGTFCDVENPFTVSEAYRLIECLYEGKDKDDSSGLRLINTGTIDKYISLWGIKTTSYIKRKYNFPLINIDKFKSILPKRYHQSISKKIIISGMRYFECFLDIYGKYVSGKSTLLIRTTYGELDLESLLGILNSKLVSFYLKEAYNAAGIGGGVNFTAPMLKKIPIPENRKISSYNIREITNKINSLTCSKDFFNNREKQEKVRNLQKEIDEMVYDLYDLTEDEKEIIRNFKG